MRLSHLRAVYESDGPFATAYVRTTREAATAGRQVELRARHVAAALTEKGAPAEAGDAIAAALTDGAAGAPAQRVLVWAGGKFVFDAAMPETGNDLSVCWGPVPDLYAYVRNYANAVPHVVAVVDRVGGDLTAFDAMGEVREVESVDGTTLHLRKVKVGDWANVHYQHQVEEHWKANAEEVAAAVERLVDEVRAEALVLAGDVRAREKLHGKLSERSQGLLSEIEHGGRAEGVDEAAFDAAVHESLDQRVRGLVSERYDMFTQRLGKGGAAAQGVADVVAAASQAKLDTLFLGLSFNPDAEAWIGPSPEHIALTREDAETLGADRAVSAPVGAALLRSTVMTDGSALAVPYEHPTLRDGIGALLRF
ncbi:MAG TPA: Vms1/Ankzf1 family peptidyl-tRNA hydrolase [Acidothermaceae bacterium]|nr:Vms1/Ankzf1 family peptidyl-tRNA hydrolase [Acidothermaceae bacterium]